MSRKLTLEPSAAELPVTLGPALAPPTRHLPREQAESLFEHVAWLYAFCRERLFRDDTDRISSALWPDGNPPDGAKVFELGCGPGFYSCRLALRYPQISVVGVDRSSRQLAWARSRAQALGLRNCHFESGNVLDIACEEDQCDALVASRLFTVLPEREQAMAEMHRVLRPGGQCFIAEPRHAFRASIPLVAMWILAGATHFKNGYREPRRAVVLSRERFNNLCASQPWKKIESWRDHRYQYALCEKA